MSKLTKATIAASLALAAAGATGLPPRDYEGKRIDPEEVIRRAEDCSYLSEADVKAIIERYRNK